MNGAQLFALIEPAWRANAASRIPQRLVDQFIAEERAGLIEMLDAALAARRARAAQKSQDVDDPPELWTKAQRTKANLAALRIVASKKPEDLTPGERRQLLAYSSWGGLSIADVKDQLPAGFEPDDFELIHAYFTPLAIADAIAEHVCPLLPELAGHDGVVRILEPSAGIGRFLRAMGRPSCIDPAGPVRGIEWITVELSKVTSRLLTALRPDARHYHMPFERFAREHGSEYAGRFHVILSNPPYGERGEFALEDPSPLYRERVAYAYFMRRALDMLVPGGLGVFIVPGGFLTSGRNRELRAKILARHHLAAAFRLPSHTPGGREVFPGASVVVDVLFFRARGGELTEIDEDDRFILDGKYYEHFPTHLLGTPAGELDEEANPKRPWRYKVVGDFTGIPAFEPRSMCASCALRAIAAEEPLHYESGIRAIEESTSDLAEPLRSAVDLGVRVDRYLAAVAANDADRAEGMWTELRLALLDFAKHPDIEQAGGPWRYLPLRRHAERSAGAQQLLNAFTPTGELAPALAEPPRVTRRFTGAPDDVVAQAEHLFRQRGHLRLPELEAFHREVGGTQGRDTILERLFAADWNLDHEDELVPLDAYVTGELWPKYDRARARGGDPQAALQARRLLEAIAPAVFEDISDITPSQRWVPLNLISAWLSATYNRELGPVELERVAGLTRVKGHAYGSTDELAGLTAETVWILGWINHDKFLFDPDDDDDDDDGEARRKKAELRARKAEEYAASFHNWLRDHEDRRQRIADAYNREFKGIITPKFSGDPLSIARWGDHGPTLKPHQIAGARRLLALRRGMLAFDVGVGKTFTGVAVVMRARQEGWVRRPVVLVPSSLVWEWYNAFRCCAPDYRILVIGSNLKRISRGKRKGVLTSETDTPEERAQKWQAFQAGQADVVILSFDALSRTKMNEDAVVEYARKVEGIRREIAIRQRNAKQRLERGTAITERQQAILKHGVRAFVQEHLELPEGHKFDPGVAWDDLGIDLLMVDEAAAFKNLYMPEEREAGVPKFMGGAGEGSQRAWQLDFRAAVVRRNTGGAGVMLLTATPAKNSPLEFYNLIQMIEPRAFSSRLSDPEQFIDRYLRIEMREVLGVDLKSTVRSAVTGFKNLDELRNIIMTYGEFRTAEEVGLKLPTARVQLVEVDMDARQAAKYDRYVSEIEAALKTPKQFAGNQILGALARLSLVALHSQLDEGYKWKNALTGGESLEILWTEDEDGNEVKKTRTRVLPPPDFRAPKLVACARRIAAQRGCGHIVFCESTAIHAWMIEALVEHGVPRERIAVLNAEVTKPADRMRIAREFNGLPPEPPKTDEGCVIAGNADVELAPRYDVVIANSVAYEGVNLQVRTCIIHHLDLPWTPSDLEQRNGRAYRQGNRLDTLEILYYLSKKSMDGYRFGLIDGKANWLGAILESGRRDTNNPAAQQQLTPDEILVMISRNPEETAKRVEAAKAKAREEERLRVAREAARLMNQANARFRDARATGDPERGVQLRAEGHARLRQLRKYDPEVWPWARWIDAVEHVEYLVPPDGQAPVYEGLRVARPSKLNPDAFEHLEFGRLIASEGPACIGVRQAGSARWVCQNLATVNSLEIRPDHLPGGPVPWDTEDEARTAATLDDTLQNWFKRPQWRALGWTSASDAWLERWWPRAEGKIRDGLAVADKPETVPVLVDGALRLLAGPKIREGTLIPPTVAGWQQFLALAPASGEKFTDLKTAGELWWARKIPQTLLSAARADDETESEDAAERANAPANPPAVVDHEDAPEEATTDTMAAPRRAEDPARPYEEARSAIKALDLPAKKRAYYVGQAERAIAQGKSYLPVLKRARKAAEGLGRPAGGAGAGGAGFHSRPPQPRLRDVMLDTFNAEPRWRLAELRSRPNGPVFVVYPEGRDADAAVASIDVITETIDEVRWLDDRVSQADQDTIMERLDRALWAAIEVRERDNESDDDEKLEIPSPLHELVSMMQRRSQALGARPEISQNLERADGYQQIAEALRDLAGPSGISAEELEKWLESVHLMEAGEVVARSRTEPISASRLMQALWDSILEAYPVTEVEGEIGRLRLPGSALWALDKDDTVFERVEEGAQASLRPIRVRTGELDERSGTYAIEDPTDRLMPGALVHTKGRSEWVLADVYRKVRAFHHNLVQAPKALHDVRVLLYWTAVMLDAPLCQGDVKQRATVAFEQAKAYYDTARRKLMEGLTVDAVRRIHEALRRISAAAAEIAKSCGEGQIEMAVTPPHLPVRPEDEAAIEGGRLPPVTAMAANPSVSLMAGSRRRKPASAPKQPRPASAPQIEAEDDRYVWLVRFEVRKFYVDTGFEFDPRSLLRSALPWAEEDEIAGEVLESLPYNRETGRYAWIARVAVSSFQVDTGFELDPRGLLQDALPHARGRDIAGEVLDSREPLNKDDEDDDEEA